MRTNLLLDTDSYKTGMFLQYPPNTEHLYSYIESRGGKWASTVFFGLQMILMEGLCQGFTVADVEEAAVFYATHGVPFNKNGFLAMYRKYQRPGTDTADFPVRIKAVKEGTVVPTRNILMSVESTDKEFFWIVSYLETMLLRVWYPVTVATQSYMCKKIIQGYLRRTSDDPAAEIMFKLHDFGSRGVSSRESAGLGGAAHLVNFMGSDTVEGVRYANHFYKSPMSGFSIPAAEHSTITSWGREGEVNAYSNMLKQFAKPGALVAIVSDSYDLWKAISTYWGQELRRQVVESGAIVVIRPDSGVPHEVVLKSVQLLDKAFGSKPNSMGYKVLNNVRVIQGDGINAESIDLILHALEENGYSASNVAFGMGGALLQSINRDTLRFAMKCSWAQVDGKGREVFKDPITDPGKKSKAGRLSLVKENGEYKTVPETAEGDLLEVVYENGKLLRVQTLEEIRGLAK